MGADHVIFGSYFPHAEGLANPADFAESLAGFSSTETDMIMGENLAALMGCC
jgi:hypothetical protein